MFRFWSWLKRFFRIRNTPERPDLDTPPSSAPTTPIDTTPPLKTSGTIFFDGKTVDITVEGFSNLKDDDLKFFQSTMSLMLQVINSADFRNRFLQLDGTEKNGNTTRQIYDYIMSGMQSWDKVADYSLEFFFNLYTESSNTIGWTNLFKSKINTNRKYFDAWKIRNDRASLAGHIFHEMLHNIGNTLPHRGFSHSSSIVYKGGYLMSDLCSRVIKGTLQLTPLA